VAAKGSPNSSTVAGAKKNLGSSLAIARKCSYLEYEYKLGLALGEIDFACGDSRQGRELLETVASDAREHGFALIARLAAAALKAQPARQN
jgi:hypothetical protein